MLIVELLKLEEISFAKEVFPKHFGKPSGLLMFKIKFDIFALHVQILDQQTKHKHQTQYGTAKVPNKWAGQEKEETASWLLLSLIWQLFSVLMIKESIKTNKLKLKIDCVMYWKDN